MNSPHADRDSHVAALIRSRQAAEANPGDVAAHFNEALALCQLGQWEQALAAWERVVRLEPDNGFAHVNRGIVYLEQEQWELAERAFVQAASCSSDHAAAYFGLGIAYAQQGQHEAAKDALKQTLRLDPDHAEARHNLDFLMGLPINGAQENAPAVLSDSMPYAAQVDCVITSQITMLPVTWDVDAPSDKASPAEQLIKPAAVGEGFAAPSEAALPAEYLLSPDLSEEKAPGESRIKLPPVIGMPLDAIAHSVITAQQESLTEQVAAKTGQAQNADEPKNTEPVVEPTLELKGREVKKEHRRLRRDEASARSNVSTSSAKGKWTAGGAMAVIALLLAAWGAQRMGGHNTLVSPSGSSAPSGLSVTSASLKAGNPVAIPSPAAPAAFSTSDMDTGLPQAVQPAKSSRSVSSDAAPTDDRSISHTADAKPALPKRKPTHTETVANDAPAAPTSARKPRRKQPAGMPSPPNRRSRGGANLANRTRPAPMMRTPSRPIPLQNRRTTPASGQINCHRQSYETTFLLEYKEPKMPFPKSCAERAKFRLSRFALSRFALFGAVTLLGLSARHAVLAQDAAAVSTPIPATLRLQKSPSLRGEFVYWFVNADRDMSPRLPLPAPAPDGSLTLPVPEDFRQPDAQLNVLDVQRNVIARLPVRPRAAASDAEKPSSLNLLQNGDFAQQGSHWNPELSAGKAKASVQWPTDEPVPQGTGRGSVARFAVETIDTEPWHAQYDQPGLDLREGERYTVSFWAKSDRPRPLTVMTSTDQGDYHPLGLNSHIPLRTQWRKITLPFTAMNVVPGHGRLVFVLGEALGQVDLADVRIQRGVVATPSGPNLLQNARFEEGMAHWIPLQTIAPAQGSRAGDGGAGVHIRAARQSPARSGFHAGNAALAGPHRPGRIEPGRGSDLHADTLGQVGYSAAAGAAYGCGWRGLSLYRPGSNSARHELYGASTRWFSRSIIRRAARGV